MSAAPILIARSERRESVAEANVFWWIEWRVAPVAGGRWELQRGYRGGRAGIDEGWHAMARCDSAREAARAGSGDSSYYRAESLHPLHAEAAAYLGLERRRAQWVERVRRIAQGERLAVAVREGRDAYEAALKRARLWGKAQKGEAPADKVEAIRAPLLAKHGPRVEREQRIQEAARATLAGGRNRG